MNNTSTETTAKLLSRTSDELGALDDLNLTPEALELMDTLHSTLRALRMLSRTQRLTD